MSAMVVGVVAAYLTIASGLPVFVDLKSYQPKTVSEFYADDESVLGLFHNERRFPVALDTVPKHVQHAFVAGEDVRFSVTQELIRLECACSNKTSGGELCPRRQHHYAASGPKHSADKREDDISQASGNLTGFRIERSNSKAQILETYLNEIYLGEEHMD